MDMSFFTTVPGILIVCGVVLLIIALIIFMVSSSKSKKTKNVDGVMNSSDSTIPSGISNTVEPVTVSPVTTGTGVDASSIMPEVATVADSVVSVDPVVAPVIPDMPVVSNVNDNDTIASVENNVVSLNSDSVSNFDSVIPTVSTDNNVSVPTVPSFDEIAPVEVPQSVPAIDVQPIDNVVPMDTVSTDQIAGVPTTNANGEYAMPEATNLDKTQVSVYGGVSPIDSIGTVEEVKPVIYGGNDPLEATQNIPVVENHVPYGGTPIPTVEPVQGVPEVAPVTPGSQPNPVEMPPIPTVQPVEEPEEL